MRFAQPRSLLLLTCAALFSACAHDADRRGTLRNVAVNDVVETAPMSYGMEGSSSVAAASAGAAGGAIGAGVAYLIFEAANRGYDRDFGQQANLYDYDLREALRQEFVAELNRRGFFPDPVRRVKQDGELTGAELAASWQQPQFHLKIEKYGFATAPFGKTLRPFAEVHVELRQGKEVLWDESADTMKRDNLPSAPAEKLKADPEIVRRAWKAAARLISQRLADEFARSDFAPVTPFPPSATRRVSAPVDLD